VEVIIDIFVITLVFGALISSFVLVIKTVNAGRLRTAAASLANEQMEGLRNLPYDSLSTQNGTILPQGTIPDTQTLVRSNSSFVLTTTIIYVDDPFDGCAIPTGANLYQCTDGSTSVNQDFVPVDYKRISITVAQPGSGSPILARLSSDAGAKAAETPTNTGMLLVKVNDGSGLPLENAAVMVTDVVKNISIQAFTNAQGYVFIANLPPDNQNGYHIVATKNSYSTDQTYTRTPQNPNQFQPDVDVNIQQITTQTLAIDLFSTLQVAVNDQSGAPINGVQITATSGKISQNNPLTPKNIYQKTTSAGVAQFTNVEWDSYVLTLPNGYYIVATSPYQPVSVDPNTTLLVTLTATTNNSFPRIETVSPISASGGAVITITIDGANFASNSTVALHQTGQSDLIPTQTVVDPNQKSIDVTFNLSAAATGNWDIIINSNGQIVTQAGGFLIQ